MLVHYGNRIQDSPTSQSRRINRSKVSLVKAASYDHIKVYEAVETSVTLINTLNKLVKPANKVFVKINHLSPPSPAESGIVTHPVFVQSVLKLLKTYGVDITVGDDIAPGDGDGFRVSGVYQACEKEGIRLVNLREHGFVETKCDGLILDKVYLSKIALDADFIINLPKLKTHSLTVFTGGIKNMYGTIPTGQRTRFHYDYMRVEDFSQMLTDLFATIKPHLTIMDGIMAMEGEGPSSGSLRNLGVVLASYDTVALDAVATKIIGLDPLIVLTIKYAHERGLGIGNLHDINVVGESIDDVAISNYKLPATYSSVIVSKVPAFLSKFILNQTLIRPRVIKRLCTGCLECERICPAAAVFKIDNKVAINQSQCIYCMCCHEVCRYNAIMPSRPLIGSLLNHIAHTLRELSARRR